MILRFGSTLCRKSHVLMGKRVKQASPSLIM